MGKIWIIIIAIVALLVMGFLSYHVLKGYVKETLGKKWLRVWGNRLYFWQSLLFLSVVGTVLIMFLLKWTNLLVF